MPPLPSSNTVFKHVQTASKCANEQQKTVKAMKPNDMNSAPILFTNSLEESLSPKPDIPRSQVLVELNMVRWVNHDCTPWRTIFSASKKYSRDVLGWRTRIINCIVARSHQVIAKLSSVHAQRANHISVLSKKFKRKKGPILENPPCLDML